MTPSDRHHVDWNTNNKTMAATASLPLIICYTLQFSVHKASIEVKGTSVELEIFHKALNFIVKKRLLLGDQAGVGAASAACTRLP